jgi:DNA-binding NtrC family response regulator
MTQPVPEHPPWPRLAFTGQEQAAGPPRGLRVLIVEDHADLAHTLRDILDRLASVVPDIAYDAAGALRAIRRGRFDLVLVDERLPDMPGSELLRGMSDEQGAWRVLMTTHYDGLSGNEVALACGAHSFLQKPIDASALIRLVEDVVAAKEA